MKKVKTFFKSKTAWGGLIFAIAQYLEAEGFVSYAMYQFLQTAGAVLGLYGARNTKSKGK